MTVKLPQLLGQEARLDHHADRGGFGLLGLQVWIARAPLRRQLADVGRVDVGEIGRRVRRGTIGGAALVHVGHASRRRAAPDQGFAIDIVVGAVRARDHGGVDLLKVRGAEALGPRGADAEPVDDVPGGGDLGLGHVAEVRIVLEPAGQLNLQIMHQRNVHLR